MVQIGRRIRYFREKAGMTQGRLAELLNISPQAVSKWETTAACPDIGLIPRLADCLGISCDALLTDGGRTEAECVHALLVHVRKQEAITHDSYMARVCALEDALERYPRSCDLMLELAYLYSSGTMYPEYSQCGWPEKIAVYCERVISITEIPKQKYEAAQLLCYTESVSRERIRVLADGMPEICQTKPALRYFADAGEPRYEGMYAYFGELLDAAQSMLSALIGDGADSRGKFDELRALAADRSQWYCYK